MPDIDDTTACAAAQGEAPRNDERFVGVTNYVLIDACAAIADGYAATLRRDPSRDNIRFAAMDIAQRIRGLKRVLSSVS